MPTHTESMALSTKYVLAITAQDASGTSWVPFLFVCFVFNVKL